MNIKQRSYYLAQTHRYNYDAVMDQLHTDEAVKSYPIKDEYISIVDNDYPSCLLDLQKPPIHLCYQGNKELLKQPKIAVIGSRMNSEYGAWIVKEIVKRLDKRLIIVSGLAKGIDGIAHEEAIANGMKTIGVIGSGLAYIYPKEHEKLYHFMAKHHLIISEYQYDEPIQKHHFPARNRIIAAMADILVVVESKIRSGSSTTVKEALELGKDIYCVPHRLCDELGAGNHLLIQEGANIIYDIDEFCNEINGRNNLTNHKIPLR